MTEAGSPRRWHALAIASAASFTAFLDVTVVNIAFPDIRDSFADASLSDLSWILNAYNIVFAAMLVPAGRLADRFGRRRVLLIGLWIFLAGSVACGAATSVELLVAARVVQAIGGAVVIPASLALVLAEFPLSQRATATGLWGGAAGVAAAAGPSLGGLVVDATSWRWVFFINVPIGIATIVAARRVLAADSPARGEPLPDPVGVVLFALGIGAVTLGVVQGPEWGWSDSRVLAAFAAGALLFTAFVWRSRNHAAPAIELSIFRLRSLAVANAATFLFSLAFYALLLSVVLWMTGVWQYSFLTAGFALTVGPVTGAAAAALGGRLADRFGARPVAVAGSLLFTVGCVLYVGLLTPEVQFVSAYLPGAIATGAGIGLTFAALTTAAVDQLPPDRYATGTALATCSRQVGAVLGISGLVALFESAAPADLLATFDRAWALMAIAGAVTAATALAIGARGRRRAPNADAHDARGQLAVGGR